MAKRIEVFSQSHTANIHSSIEKLFKYMEFRQRIHLTWEQVVRLTTPKEFRELLFQVRDIVDSGLWSEGINVPWRVAPELGFVANTTNLHFEYWTQGGKSPPAVYKKPSLQPDADPVLVEQITEWLNGRIKLGRDFGLVKKVFDKLNIFCRNKEQLRYMFPSILALMDLHPDTRRLVSELSDVKPPRDTPYLPYPVRQGIRKAAAIVTTSLLLPVPDGMEKHPPVELRHNENRIVEIDGLKVRPY